MSKEAPTKSPTQTNDNREIIHTLINQANAGEDSVMPKIRELLRHAPHLIPLMGGDLSQRAEQLIVDRLSGDRLAMKQSLSENLQRLRDELSGPNSTPLERLLVERVVTCWLHVQFADLQLVQRGEVSVTVGDYLQRQQDRAHRRFLAAVKSLTTVRRLALPIQIDLNVSTTRRGPDTP